jgi:hypothetical protein
MVTQKKDHGVALDARDGLLRKMTKNSAVVTARLKHRPLER